MQTRPNHTPIRASCSCAGAVAVMLIDGALACAACRTPVVAAPPAAPDYYDQRTSPLGRKRHLAAVRSGELAASAVGKLRLVTRVEMERYLASHAASPANMDPPADLAGAILAELGARRA